MTHGSIRLLTAALVATSLALAGCSAGAETKKPTIVAGFYPYQFVAERIGGDTADVVGLTAPGAEPHDLELTPKQVSLLGEADLVIYQQGLQPAVDKAVEQHSNVAALEIPSPTIEDEPDPHVWLDPQKLAGIASLLGQTLAKLDADNAAGYESRAEALATELTTLDGEFREALGGLCKRRTIVTGHAAFGHLAKRYQLKQVPITGINPDDEPSSEQLDEITKAVRKNQAATLFVESLLDPDVAEIITKKARAEVATLDPIESHADGGDYFTQMRANLDALKKALDC